MLIKYLNTLKDQGNFTFDEISEICDIPKDTVKNIYSGKTKDPGIITTSKLIYGMGGNLDAIYRPEKRNQPTQIHWLCSKKCTKNTLPM
jgi:hypothetical protein